MPPKITANWILLYLSTPKITYQKNETTEFGADFYRIIRQLTHVFVNCIICINPFKRVCVDLWMQSGQMCPI